MQRSQLVLNLARRRDIQLFLLSALLCYLLADFDLAVSRLFYDADLGGWHWHNNLILQVLYKIFAKPQWLLLPLIILAIYNYRKFNLDSFKKYIYLFLLCSLLLGPGFLVNTVLKNNSIGRARPAHLAEFDSDRQHIFTPAFVYSGQCKTNCSFVSGHASIGFYLIGLGWLLRSRKYFWLGFGVGCLLGFTRIAQGGHFLSDVILAFWVVYLTNIWLGYKFNLKNPVG